MSRISIVLALLGILLGGVSLWIATDESAASALEHRRLDATRTQMERSMQSMRLQIAGLRTEISTLGQELGSGVARSTANEPQANRSGDASGVSEFSEGGSASAAEPATQTSELLQRFRQLTSEAKQELLKDAGKHAALSEQGSLEIVLEGLVDASPEVRERAVKALGDRADPALLDHLAQAAMDSSEVVREAVAKSLEKMPADQAGPILVGLLRDPDPKVAEESIKSIAKLGYENARPHLVDRLSAENLDVASRAASVLRELGEESYTGGIVERIMRNFSRTDAATDERIRDVNRLRRVGGTSAVGQLKWIMEQDPALSVQAEAREALVKLGE